jgi:GNAT superfamily N-acetyltransferase
MSRHSEVIQFRTAVPEDAEPVHRFICGLAEHVRHRSSVEVTVATLREQLAASPQFFRCLIAQRAEQAAGFAVYFFTYSTWQGRRGLYLEDLFVAPQERGLGVGRALMTQLAAIAAKADCGRFEWNVLDWNQAATDFYRTLGARPVDGGSTNYRLSGEGLRALSGERAHKLETDS